MDKNGSNATDPLEAVGAITHPHRLSIIKEAEAGGGVVVRHALTLEQFDAPRLQGTGVARHKIATLIHLLAYVKPRKGEGTVAFYTTDGVRVVLDEGEEQHRLVDCTLQRSHRFMAWWGIATKSAREPVSQVEFVHFLRRNSLAIAEASSEEETQLLVGAFESLRGTLVHDAEEHRATKSRTASFTVRRTKRAGQSTDLEVEDVPMGFEVSLPILADDAECKLFSVSLDVVGGEGAEPRFRIELDDAADIITDHIESRLGQFAAEAGFLCVRGTYETIQPAELGLPKQAAEFLEMQAKLLAAQAGSAADD